MSQEIIITNQHDLRNIVAEAIREQLVDFSKWFESKLTTQERLLNRKEAIAFLKISPSTLSRWTKDGKIPSHGCGSRVFYKLSELEASLIALNCS